MFDENLKLKEMKFTVLMPVNDRQDISKVITFAKLI